MRIRVIIPIVIGFIWAVLIVHSAMQPNTKSEQDVLLDKISNQIDAINEMNEAFGKEWDAITKGDTNAASKYELERQKAFQKLKDNSPSKIN